MADTKLLVQFAYGLQSGYDAIQSKDLNTIYFCTDSGRLFKGDVEFSRPVQHGSALPGDFMPPNSTFVVESNGYRDLYYSKDGASWEKIGRVYTDVQIGTKGEATARTLDFGDTFKVVNLTVDAHGFVTSAKEIELTLPDAPEAIDISGKADKAVPATAGNLAGLDADGNLQDSGVAAASVALKSDLTDGNITAKKAENAEKATKDASGNVITETYATKEALGDLQETVEGIDNHSHANKDLLDTYTQTNADLADAVAKKHEHANKAELDKIADGDKAKWDKAVEDLAGEIERATEADEENAQAAADALAEAQAKVASVAAGDNSVTVAGTSTAPTVAVKLSQDADNAMELAADGLKVVIPAAAEYTIEKSDDAGDYAAVYKLMKDGAQVGAAINIPKDIVVKSGSVVGDEIVLVLNDKANTEIRIPVGSLIEYVTSGSQTGDMVVITVDDDHKVTATITDGTITLAKLATDVQTKVNKAHDHENKDVLDGIDANKVAAWDAAEANAIAAAAADATTKANAAQTAAEQTAAADATAKANAAQAAAEATAAADATSKANAAQAAAEATASADATSKANAAESNAKAYADEQIAAAALTWQSF